MTDEPRQRTSLARDRTALAAAVVGAVLMKFGVDDAIAIEIVAGVVAFAAAATLGVVRHHRTQPRAVAVVAALVATTALLTVVAVLS
jgi:predicted PurR-regulated permease PerM